MGGSGPVGFDLDMTLINSRPAILASFAETSRETGTAIDLDAVNRVALRFRKGGYFRWQEPLYRLRRYRHLRCCESGRQR